MSDFKNIQPNKLDDLLEVAGKKLGKDPQALKEQLQSGNLNSVLSGLSPQQSQQVSNLLNDKQALSQFMENPQIKQIIAKMSGRG